MRDTLVVVRYDDGMDRIVRTGEDLLLLLDDLLGDPAAHWDWLYSGGRTVPFTRNVPDESLVEWCSSYLSIPGRCIDLGCGFGRNSIHLSRLGWSVDALDVSPVAVRTTRQRAAECGVTLAVTTASLFAATLPARSFDLVYDGGCFHHIAPHRRPDYLRVVSRCLAPGGFLGMVCLSDRYEPCTPDAQVYKDQKMWQGLLFSEEKLRSIFEPQFTSVEFRPMRKRAADAADFGEDYLWAVLMQHR